MAIARTAGALVGTNESSLQTVSASATFSGTEVDVLGDNSSLGEAWFYIVVTDIAVSSIDVTINQRRLTGQAYKKLASDVNIPTINGTQMVPLGKMPVERFLQADVKNNDGSNSVQVAVLYTLEKVS